MQLPTDGVFQLGSSKGIKLHHISDGTSNTILVGEKHVPLRNFGEGWLDSSVYNGEYPVSYLRGAGMGVGLARFRDEISWKWGSYHTGVCLFALCDGSVRGLAHHIDPTTLAYLCHINDGQVLGEF